jgi:hypothetical protein
MLHFVSTTTATTTTLHFPVTAPRLLHAVAVVEGGKGIHAPKGWGPASLAPYLPLHATATEQN